ncbi:MAG: hypothetical protein V1904_15520 [Bacteroidota bacterium]
MKDEIIIYQPNKQSTRLEVRIEEDTVWLSQAQMVELFDSTKQNISLHINNVFKENELSYKATVKDYLTVQREGSRFVKLNISVNNPDINKSHAESQRSQRIEKPLRLGVIKNKLKNNNQYPITNIQFPGRILFGY